MTDAEGNDELVAHAPDGGRVRVPELVVRRVWVAAGGRCTFCNKLVVENETTGQPVFTGELAHIVGATRGPKSPRGEHDLSLPDRALAENLMLLCGDEHKVVDTNWLWDTYTVEQLRAIKAKHEREIRELTGLRSRPRTTVLRVVGDIHGDTSDFSRDRIVSALLASQRFPDFTLPLDGDFEIDLRREMRGGETLSDAAYWSYAETTLRERLAPLGAHLKRQDIEHISVFALARIPVLVLLGSLLDDAKRLTVYNKRRDADLAWGWPSSEITPGLDYAVEHTPGSGDPLVTFSISGPVDLENLPAPLNSAPRYDLRLTGVDLSPTALRSEDDLEGLRETWRSLLARLEQDHRGKVINVIAAVPAVAAVTIGSAPMRAAHPPLRVWDLDRSTGRYTLTLEVTG